MCSGNFLEFVLAFFFCCIAVVGLGLLLAKLHNKWLRLFHVRFWLFVGLFSLGTALYFVNPVDRADSLTCCCPQVNSVTCCALQTNAVPSCASRLNVPLRWLIGFFESMNRTASAFFPSRGGYEQVTGTDSRRQAWWKLLYYGFHLMIILFVAELLYSIFGQLFGNKFQRWWIRLSLYRWWRGGRELYVFWCDSEAARVLAEDIHARGNVDILFLLPGDLKHDEQTRDTVGWLSRKGYIVDFVNGLPGRKRDNCCDDSEGGKRYAKAIELEPEDLFGCRHFILGEDSGYNVLLADAIVRSCKENSSRRALSAGPMDIYVRVESSVGDAVLNGWADNMSKSLPNVMIHLVSETDRMAEAFIGEHPLLWGRSSPLITSDFASGYAHGEVKLLVIGFGNRGQALLNVMIENGQFLLDDKGATVPFSAEIVDAKQEAWDQYCERSPEVPLAYAVRFCPLDALGGEFRAKYLDSEAIFEYGRIVVCTGDDELNLGVGSMIRKRFATAGRPLEEERLFVQLQSKEVLVRSEAAVGQVEGIGFFGTWDTIFTYDNLVAEVADYGARLLNWWYSYESYGEPPSDRERTVVRDGETKVIETVDQAWRRAACFDRESSKASFCGERNLLALLGYETIPFDADVRDMGHDFLLRVGESAVLDVLAKNEHLRWMAFMRTHGVQSWNLRQPSMEATRKMWRTVKGDETVGLKANMRMATGRHAALVPYNELPDVDLKIAAFNDPKTPVKREMFVGEGAAIGAHNNLQWNDIKFVRWIPDLTERLWVVPAGKRMIVRPVGGLRR